MRIQLIKKSLRQWDDNIPDGLLDRMKKRESRRDFLKLSSVLPASIFISACDKSRSSAATTKQNKSTELPLLEQEPWKTFVAVHNHLFPKQDDSPGADDINATLYLKSVLELPGTDNEDKQFIRDGVKWLHGISHQMYNKKFYQLKEAPREAVLKRIATSSAGESWLSLLLLYLFEALLADPVYGGNTNKIGWQWLEHKPGFPTPGNDKKYYQLR